MTGGNYDVDIEIWPIRTSRDDPAIKPVVEVSFKTETATKAVSDRAALAGFCKEKGWFLPQDSLKTQLIMLAYA